MAELRPSLDVIERPTLVVCPSFETPYQYLVDDLGTRVSGLMSGLRERFDLAAGSVLFGFSGGAQFVHRYALRYPDGVSGCVALAAGCWTLLSGQAIGMQVDEGWFERTPWSMPEVLRSRDHAVRLTDRHRSTYWVVGCGSEDHPSRIESAERFRKSLVGAGLLAKGCTWSGGHDLPGAEHLGPVLKQVLSDACQ
ncbi:hypothetical protein Pan265_03480 [Mucisphaera calidilacus]|uniref:Esterase n=2 Tax=Mucisphaera calidilacus TaxID=2527982 RepID=A0A518BU52_9BACT|nr:hypothetical protein Pan265_03480 [Mucisphaera calidilacus]